MKRTGFKNLFLCFDPWVIEEVKMDSIVSVPRNTLFLDITELDRDFMRLSGLYGENFTWFAAMIKGRSSMLATRFVESINAACSTGEWPALASALENGDSIALRSSFLPSTMLLWAALAQSTVMSIHCGKCVPEPAAYSGFDRLIVHNMLPLIDGLMSETSPKDGLG